ncbi:ABC transporter ATP-binding protein [Vibrio hippocampi]|uniref:Oligosaccharides import ATP-binding protein MsmX n=1 Tax=Vibrio hippocampi TaxID=654686 RepID=A0ABM8ZKR7_9VIBR|nr:sn-glycerol-3-phosphate ABC transporter ATP-binding protein UgpC [Vibrio hippocampi]CAH0528852.1 Oligosaccharides import ATP-binding protein MsmX [Vibrio hippocampi]
MATIQFKNVDKIYSGNECVVKDFNLDIEDGEFVVFLGPSGCGKSTTLRMLSGLEYISNGEVLIDGKVVNNLSPKDRNIAMVFQSYALYPHMTVFDNIGFSLKMAGESKSEINRQVRHVADMLQLTPLLNRKPKALSGGQRQRVAMGRALVRTPEVFLFDEPLSNLDAKLRNVMRAEIKELHKKHRKTTVYVTHDQVEAMTLADKVVILRDGVIEQVGTPKEIYHHPINHFVASFIGSPTMNMLPVVIETENDEWFARLNEHSINLPRALEIEMTTRSGVLGIRPCDVHLHASVDSIALDVYIDSTELLGSTTQVNGKVGAYEIVIEVEGDADVKVGEVVQFYLDSNKMHIFNSHGSVIL